MTFPLLVYRSMRSPFCACATAGRNSPRNPTRRVSKSKDLFIALNLFIRINKIPNYYVMGGVSMGKYNKKITPFGKKRVKKVSIGGGEE